MNDGYKLLCLLEGLVQIVNLQTIRQNAVVADRAASQKDQADAVLGHSAVKFPEGRDLAPVYICPGRRAACGLDNAVVNGHAAELDGRENLFKIAVKGSKILVLGVELFLLCCGQCQAEGLDFAGVDTVTDGAGAQGRTSHTIHALGRAGLDDALAVAVDGIGKRREVIGLGGL